MPVKEEKHLKTYLFLTFAMVCWGLSFVWYKQALLYFAPITLVLFRLIMSIPLLIIAAVSLKRLKRIKKQDYKWFLLLAFLEPFVYFLGESYGMKYVSSTVAAIIISTIPIFTSIIAYLFLNEKLTLKNYFGMLLSFVGVLAVILAENELLNVDGRGVALIFVAVVAAMLYGFVIKKFAAKYNTLTIVTTQNLIGILYFIPAFFIVDFKTFYPEELTLRMFVPVIYLSFFASTLAYIGFIEGLRVLGLAKATVFTNFIPVFTAIFALIILNEKITILKVGGIILVVGGLILSQSLRGSKQKKEEEVFVDELY